MDASKKEVPLNLQAGVDRAGTSTGSCEGLAMQQRQPYQRDIGSYQRDIGWAVKQLWNGGQVRRRGWNGRGMHIALQAPDMHSKMSVCYIYMRTVEGHLVPWVASQSDMLATDWEMAEA